ncbi:cysteine protease ATG4A isoform X1 [Selaginella moellendorffii]|nr:cysteine protease ATG4A isoform X1 [Selaginella moellendorffii]|eukprot:XP_024536428.1 cysteine protease ATG4A isoform X1 [Selaginella moellendorffii]
MGHSPSPPPPLARINGEVAVSAAAAAEGIGPEVSSIDPSSEEIIIDAAAVAEEGAANSSAPNSSSSLWSSLISSTLGVFDARAGAAKARDKGLNSLAGSLQWTAAVRRAVGPVRRIQECLMGMRGGNGISSGSAIWLLGACYRMGASSTSSTDEEAKESTSSSPEAVADFLLDFSSRIWITYRQGFEAIGESKFTSDVGWGCMIRSGQMLFAQALVCHRLGRGWRRGEQPYAREYLEILHSFVDSPSPACPFSIHNFIRAGSPYGLAAGSWLGPYALCHAIEALARNDGRGREGEDHLAVYVVSGDAHGERGGAPVLYNVDVAGKCPVLILVPLVLGLDKINPRYLPSLRATFAFPQSVGIAGGKPAASVYFVGVQDDQALYLDPHEVQKVVSVSGESLEFDSASYHCSVVRKMLLDAIDPSLALGFYCRNREDLDDLCARASELASQSNGAPMFTVAEGFGRTLAKEQETSESTSELRLDKLNLGMDSTSEEDWQIL